MEEIDNIRYNDIPVLYCKNCLSLNIRTLDSNTEYCDDCGNTIMEEAHIDKWKDLYEKKYGEPLIKNK